MSKIKDRIDKLLNRKRDDNVKVEQDGDKYTLTNKNGEKMFVEFSDTYSPAVPSHAIDVPTIPADYGVWIKVTYKDEVYSDHVSDSYPQERYEWIKDLMEQNSREGGSKLINRVCKVLDKHHAEDYRQYQQQEIERRTQRDAAANVADKAQKEQKQRRILNKKAAEKFFRR